MFKVVCCRIVVWGKGLTLSACEPPHYNTTLVYLHLKWNPTAILLSHYCIVWVDNVIRNNFPHLQTKYGASATDDLLNCISIRNNCWWLAISLFITTFQIAFFDLKGFCNFYLYMFKNVCRFLVFLCVGNCYIITSIILSLHIRNVVQ